MSDSGTAIFHCGRCGALFKAATGVGVVRRCQECGGDPVPPAANPGQRERRSGEADNSAVVSHGTRNEHLPQGGPARSRSHSHDRQRRKLTAAGRNLVIFIGAWVLLLGVLAVSFKLAHERSARAERERAAQRRQAEAQRQEFDPRARMNERERVFLTKSVPGCRLALYSFLQSVTPETRAQWVSGGADTIGRMQRFEQSNSWFFPEKMPEQEYVGVLETSEGPMVESRWLSAEGYRIEAVFRRERGEWRLDWDAFTRFSETPWVMFLAGAGAPLQEFRLLARERLAGERKLDPALSLVFHPPRFGVPDEAGSPSPEFVVPRLSASGRKLEALLRLRREGKTPLGAALPLDDPSGMIRVRVKVRRNDGEQGSRRFLLEEVLAGHWLSLKESGIPDDERDSSTPAEQQSGAGDTPSEGPSSGE